MESIERKKIKENKEKLKLMKKESAVTVKSSTSKQLKQTKTTVKKRTNRKGKKAIQIPAF